MDEELLSKLGGKNPWFQEVGKEQKGGRVAVYKVAWKEYREGIH